MVQLLTLGTSFSLSRAFSFVMLITTSTTALACEFLSARLCFFMAPQIYGGDLVIAVDILAKMAQYNAIQGNVSSTDDLKNYAKVASNLLDSTNNRTWKELERVS